MKIIIIIIAVEVVKNCKTFSTPLKHNSDFEIQYVLYKIDYTIQYVEALYLTNYT